MMKLKDFIERNPAIKERSSISKHCLKTLVGTVYEEGRNLYYMKNDDSVFLICSDFDSWAMMDDSSIIYSDEFFCSIISENMITIVDTAGEKVRRMNGAIDNNASVVYLDDGYLTRWNPDGTKNKLKRVEKDKAHSVYVDENNIISVYRSYGDSSINYSEYFDEQGNYLENETKDDLLKSFHTRILAGFISGKKLQKALSCNSIDIVNYYLNLDLIKEEGGITCSYIERVIKGLKRMCILNDNQARLFKRFKLFISNYKLDDKFQDVFLNVMDLTQNRKTKSNGTGGIFTKRTLDLIDCLELLFPPADIRKEFPIRYSAEHMIERIECLKETLIGKEKL